MFTNQWRKRAEKLISRTQLQEHLLWQVSVFYRLQNFKTFFQSNNLITTIIICVKINGENAV
jgi:hypothetical protein